MTKSKKFVSRMMFALVILTLVSFCFVGFTFARYTTGGTSTATVTVAKWDIAVTNTHTTTSPLDLSTLSPKAEAYQGGESYDASKARSHSTARSQILTITNNSAVDANVTLTITVKVDTVDLTNVYKIGSTTEKADATYVEALVAKHISFDLYDAASAGNEITADGYTIPTLTAKVESQDAKVLDVYAVVTWTSDIDSVFGAEADAEDTFIGQYVTGITYTVNYTAVQASQLPTA